MSAEPWLSVVGIGEDGLAGLTSKARACIDSATALFGGARHLAMIAEDDRPRIAWPSPFDPVIEQIRRYRPGPICVLASGDPFCFGVGAVLARHFSMQEMTVIPGLSAFALARARLGWSIDAVTEMTLHGRPLESIAAELYPSARVLVLSAGPDTPMEVARLLVDRGYAQSRLTVFENMGGNERTTVVSAAALAQPSEEPSDRQMPEADPSTGQRAWPAPGEAVPRFSALNTLAVECIANDTAKILSRVPGLADDAYESDGQLTKRAVRAATLSALRPLPGALLWDVGAGNGSIAIEWCRAAPRTQAIAIERNQDRAERLMRNAERLGTPGVRALIGTAPSLLHGLPTPDAIFIGGGLGAGEVATCCWEALRPGGRLVANAVTVEGESQLSELWRKFGGELSRIAVSHAEPVGTRHAFRPAMAVTQWATTKPQAHDLEEIEPCH